MAPTLADSTPHAVSLHQLRGQLLQEHYDCLAQPPCYLKWALGSLVSASTSFTKEYVGEVLRGLEAAHWRRLVGLQQLSCRRVQQIGGIMRLVGLLQQRACRHEQLGGTVRRRCR